MKNLIGSCSFCGRNNPIKNNPFTQSLNYSTIINPTSASATKNDDKTSKRSPIITSAVQRAHATKLSSYFNNHPHLKRHIPAKYMQLHRGTSSTDTLYLIDGTLAHTIAACVLPDLQRNPNQIVCETNAGVGLIARELLATDSGIHTVRIYESCAEFRAALHKGVVKEYPERVELFPKDIFQLHRYHYMDKQDHGDRCEQLLRGVPHRRWTDDAPMTIFGAMPNANFIKYLMKSLVLQNEIVAFGRIQLHVVMRPADYIVLTAGPHLNLHTYGSWSVLFNLLFDYTLREKFPRKAFLPWERPRKMRIVPRYAKQIDTDSMYFVSLSLKRELPLPDEHLLAFFTFVRQFFRGGKNRIVPTLEKWVPGSGLLAMLPRQMHPNYYENINVYTHFGELTPDQILAVFKEMIAHPGYMESPFKALIESNLMKTETIDTSLMDDYLLEKNIIDDIEIKLDDIK